MRDIEQELLVVIQEAMRQRGVSQSDFAKAKQKSRQAVNPYFNGKKSLLTETGKDILEYLDMRIELVARGK